jgi:hypothetical protein
MRWAKEFTLAFQPFIALTDKAWFDFLSAHAERGPIDEVNFWSPKSTSPMKTMAPGEPIFFRLKDPHYAIAGYGFFARFRNVGAPGLVCTYSADATMPHTIAHSPMYSLAWSTGRR